MDWQAYSAIFTSVGVVIAALTGLGTYVRRLATRITNAENVAKTAEDAVKTADGLGISLAAVRFEVTRVEKEFNDHRVAIAEKYVSKDALRETKIEILQAIRDLSNLFHNREAT